MYITKDRVILLDCQALWSPSLIEESNTAVTARSANVVTVDCLQIASYLMAICHVLIAVQDWFTDYNFLRYFFSMYIPLIKLPQINQRWVDQMFHPLFIISPILWQQRLALANLSSTKHNSGLWFESFENQYVYNVVKNISFNSQ